MKTLQASPSILTMFAVVLKIIIRSENFIPKNHFKWVKVWKNSNPQQILMSILLTIIFFNYHLTHVFHKLINKNSNKANKVNFSVFYTNKRFLESNFDKLEPRISNPEYKFDIIGLTGSWKLTGNVNIYYSTLASY